MRSVLVLLRHGESRWNLENRFTGWVDVELSERGVDEARAAGLRLRDAGFVFDKVHTSLLKRTIQTQHHVLEQMDRLWLPTQRSWRLNERHYGALQGLDKQQTIEAHGVATVARWRRSYSERPPALPEDSPDHPRFDARYAALAPELLPSSECLRDTVERLLPYWYDALVPDIRAGKRLLIAAHGNSLRALIKHLDKLSDEAITQLEIPTCVPIVYELEGSLQVLRRQRLS